MTESAWLIERADTNHPGCVLPDCFLGINGHTSYRAGSSLEWQPTVTFALRFARREDAEMFVGAMERLSEHLPHGLTLPGLRSGDPRPVVVEHSWSDAVAA